MKRPMYRLGVMLLALVLVLALPVTSFAATADEWDTSKSKTATNLDSNYISNITLSLPSAQEQLVTDVVFVLDKSTSTDVTSKAVEMLSQLKSQASETNAKIKVGVVVFNKTAQIKTDGLVELDDAHWDSIQSAFNTEKISGTNMHAGLLAGKKLLDDDTAVSASRKYLILISDGLTYYFCQNNDYTKAYTISSLNGGNDGQGSKDCKPCSTMECWDIKYGMKYCPSSWDDFFSNVRTVIENDYSKYVYEADSPSLPTENDSPDSIPFTQKSNYPINVDISLLSCVELYNEMSTKYNCFGVSAGITSDYYTFGKPFMEYLTGGKPVTFSAIQNDIYYLLDRGSYVVDSMGYTEEYNFDFVDAVSNISLKVGDTKYKVTRRTEDLPEGETSHYYFINPNNTQTEAINPDFELIYVKGNGAEDEHFTWKIKVPVSNFAPVQLTYSVKLSNPKTAPGTYGTYDADGSKGYPELYTNNSATLYPIDTNEDEGDSEDFNKPTVSYTISGPETQTPVPTYPVYYPDYSEEPAATPTPTPTPFVPSDETSPKTGAGDAALPALLIVALAAAGVAVVSMRKRAR